MSTGGRGMSGLVKGSLPRTRARGGRVKIEGEAPLLRSLGRPLRRALARRPFPYRVSVQSVGGCGEVLVAITTAKGRLPLRFAGDDLEPGFVSSIVRSSLDRFGL